MRYSSRMLLVILSLLTADAFGAEPSEKELRLASTEKLRQLGEAMHLHQDIFNLLPAQFTKKDDKPLLSWRVELLRGVGEQPLYDKFHHDEPWDSEHNKQFIAKMPAVFASPYEKADMVERGLTLYQVPVFKGSLFDEDAPFNYAQIRDGSSNTIMVVETHPDNAVIWTKPDDWKVDAKDPLKGVVRKKGKGFHALFVDGAVRLMDDAMDAEKWKLLLGRDDGKNIVPESLILKD